MEITQQINNNILQESQSIKPQIKEAQIKKVQIIESEIKKVNKIFDKEKTIKLSKHNKKKKNLKKELQKVLKENEELQKILKEKEELQQVLKKQENLNDYTNNYTDDYTNNYTDDYDVKCELIDILCIVSVILMLILYAHISGDYREFQTPMYDYLYKAHIISFPIFIFIYYLTLFRPTQNYFSNINNSENKYIIFGGIYTYFYLMIGYLAKLD